MLILTRRPGETILIGDQVKLVVMKIYRGQVAVGITAPREISVHREEVYQRIRKKQEEAAAAAAPVATRE